MKDIEVQRSNRTLDVNELTFEDKEAILSFIFQEGNILYDDFEDIIKYGVFETSKLFNLDAEDAFNIINEHAKEKSFKGLQNFNLN